MNEEIRNVVYDNELEIEAYCFKGIVQPFPNHFHEYYVIGFVEEGQRLLCCKNKEYILDKGSIVIFNPNDNHSCVQNGESALDYRGLNISKKTMLDLAEEVTGKRELPWFLQNVIYDKEINCYLHSLHQMVIMGGGNLEKEEALLFLISELIQNYGQSFEDCVPECRKEIERACKFMECHYRERICLEQICGYAALSKSTLLRAFTKSKGVTPYRYLINIRINKAKKLLEQGVLPIEAAIETGFSDQSHFTNYFSSFIGIAPGIYRDIFCRKNKDGDKNGK